MTEDIQPQPPAEAAAATDEVTTVSYGDFVKLTIRVGTITVAEVVPEADKLLRLEVDFGDETRQIVSGIRDFVATPEALVGTQAPFITNLAPRTIRGLESQGMILAVGDADTFAFLRPDRDVPPGTTVH
jgi:methionyl-tRNA synthetase